MRTAAKYEIAFFDVDETLIVPKSMFSFLEFYLHEKNHPPEAYLAQLSQLRQLAERGSKREDINRAYYRNFAQASVAEVIKIGQDWFDSLATKGKLFREEVRRELETLRDDGTTIVLVSGSFSGCLIPIAEHLGVMEYYGTPLVQQDGRYTGQTGTPVIGEQKALIARRCLNEAGIAPNMAIAYGDHSSDLPLLAVATTAVVVGLDPSLRKAAQKNGWRCLPPQYNSN